MAHDFFALTPPSHAWPKENCMIIADINNLARAHGGRTIFTGISWSLQDGEKIGLLEAGQGA
jgi:hypothetical protein